MLATCDLGKLRELDYQKAGEHRGQELREELWDLKHKCSVLPKTHSQVIPKGSVIVVGSKFTQGELLP